MHFSQRSWIPVGKLALLLVLTACQSWRTPSGGADPAMMMPPEPPFPQQVRAMLAQDAQSPPPAGDIVFVGSSSFRLWETLEEDMAPLPAHNRSFGGATTGDVLYWTDRLIIPLRPSVIVYYAGDNDMDSADDDWHRPVAGFQEFVRRIHAALPETRILYVSIKPSPQRWGWWKNTRKANARIRGWSARQDAVEYVDITPTLLDAQGQVRPDLFKPDGLHITDEAYADWARVLRPRLQAAWERIK